jgi:hypothetical protein
MVEHLIRYRSGIKSRGCISCHLIFNAKRKCNLKFDILRNMNLRGVMWNIYAETVPLPPLILGLKLQCDAKTNIRHKQSFRSFTQYVLCPLDPCTEPSYHDDVVRIPHQHTHATTLCFIPYLDTTHYFMKEPVCFSPSLITVQYWLKDLSLRAKRTYALSQSQQNH